MLRKTYQQRLPARSYLLKLMVQIDARVACTSLWFQTENPLSILLCFRASAYAQETNYPELSAAYLSWFSFCRLTPWPWWWLKSSFRTLSQEQSVLRKVEFRLPLGEVLCAALDVPYLASRISLLTILSDTGWVDNACKMSALFRLSKTHQSSLWCDCS